MNKRRAFRPAGIDFLEARLVLSHAAFAPAAAVLPTPVPGSVQAQNQAYVQALYAYVGRTATPAGVAYHAQELNGGRANRTQIARAFVNSTDFRNVETTALFQLLLRRAPTTADLRHFASNGNGGPSSFTNVASQIIGSREYYNLAGGTNQGFITKAYKNIFARTPDAGSQSWVNQLNQGVSRQQVATRLLNTPEGSQNLVAIAYFETFQRDSSLDPRSQAFVNSLQHGGRYEDVFVGLLASREFYNLAQTTTVVGLL